MEDITRNPATLQNYRFLELSHTQLKYLKQDTRRHKSYLLEFTGIVPEEVRQLYHWGLIDILGDDKVKPPKHERLVHNDGITKSFTITNIGKMYLLYHRRWYYVHYVPIIISLFALALSGFSLLQ